MGSFGQKSERIATTELAATESCVGPSVGPSNAENLQIEALDAGLRLIVERWAELPESLRLGIVAMVQATDERMGRK
ncbi:MAG: hypothetical protein KJ052_17000 [Candidatus Hydrogenedentes bacterium]|nr:hypothetical protein [Candidatus Hydrogenedentota bacterium]